MHTSRQKGFTLIELLVVISIIGVLSSIVLASITTAKVKSRDAAVKSALAQMELLLQQEYADTGTYRGLQGKDWNDTHVFQGDSPNDCENIFPPDTVNGPNSPYELTNDSPQKSDMVRLCNELVKYSPKNGNRFYFYHLTYDQGSSDRPSNMRRRFDAYSIQARLPSSGNFLCFGSNGKSESTSGTLTEPGCLLNNELMNWGRAEAGLPLCTGLDPVVCDNP